jgi:hypothetical protein
MFQIAISIAAIAALTKRRWFWYMGLGFGAIGTGFLIYALAFMKVTEANEAAEEPKGPAEKKAPKEPKSGETKPAKSESEAGAWHTGPRADRLTDVARPASEHSRSYSPLVPRPLPLAPWPLLT